MPLLHFDADKGFSSQVFFFFCLNAFWAVTFKTHTAPLSGFYDEINVTFRWFWTKQLFDCFKNQAHSSERQHL